MQEDRAEPIAIDRAGGETAAKPGVNPAPSPAPANGEKRIGHVVSVSGSQVVVMLEGAAEESGSPQIGGLVKMHTPQAISYGLVSGLAAPIPGKNANDEVKIAEVELLGEARWSAEKSSEHFERGVSSFPALGDAVFETTKDDLQQVYAPPSASPVRIGMLHQDRSLPAHVLMDDMLGKHFAVLGSTGCGKSCAVALLLKRMLEHHPNGHVLLLDVHNEYAAAFGNKAEVLDPKSLELPYWLFNFEEMREVVIGSDAEDRDAKSAILESLILAAKQGYTKHSDQSRTFTVDTPVPYRTGDMMRLLDDALGKLDRTHQTSAFHWIKARLEMLQSDRRYGFMFPGLAVQDNMAKILSRLFRIPVAGKPISIIDLSSVPSEVTNVVVSLLCRMTFDFALWSNRAIPILLVCEEAHRYVPASSNSGFEPTKRALARIAMEGRKYGISLGIVSQRPADISPRILSQCSTIFAMRLANQKDQEFVLAALPESARSIVGALPSLRNREAIAVGEGLPVPMRLCFDTLDKKERPHGAPANFSTAWNFDLVDPSAMNDLINRWRTQRR
jgi:hypothetical protein